MFENIYDNEKKLASLINFKKALLYIVKASKNGLTCKTKKFTGVRTLGRINLVKNKELKVKLDVIVGDAKIILVSKDRKVYKICENSFEGSINNNLIGKFRVRIVGKNADLKLTLTL